MGTQKLRFQGPLKIIYISDSMPHARRSYPTNFEQAYDILKRAADEGSGDAAAAIAHMYLNGTIRCADFREKAAEWSSKAIRAESAYGYWVRAWIYMEQRRPKDAIQDFLKAMELKFPAAAQDLGLIYQMGWGAEINLNRSMDYYFEARQLGHIKAAWSINNLRISGKFGKLRAIASVVTRPFVAAMHHLHMMFGKSLSKYMLFYSYMDKIDRQYSHRSR